MLKKIAVAGALAGCLAANASAQAVDTSADSLPVTAILEAIAREGAEGRSPLGVAVAQSISSSRIASWRVDSLLVGLRDIAIRGSTPDVRAVAAGTIAASGTHRSQAALLIEVFDSAQDTRTRATILSMVTSLPDARLQRAVILRAIQLTGDRGASFLAGMAVLTAITMGDDGVALLRNAIDEGIVTNERTRNLIEAAIASNVKTRGR